MVILHKNVLFSILALELLLVVKHLAGRGIDRLFFDCFVTQIINFLVLFDLASFVLREVVAIVLKNLICIQGRVLFVPYHFLFLR